MITDQKEISDASKFAELYTSSQMLDWISLVGQLTDTFISDNGLGQAWFPGCYYSAGTVSTDTAADPLTRAPDNSYGYRTLSTISGPLSPILGSAYDGLRKKIAIVRGLDCIDFMEGHNIHYPTTGTCKIPSSAAGFGYSIDAMLEDSLAFNSTPQMIPALRLAPNAPFDSWSFSSKTSLGQQLPYISEIRAAYMKYFDPTATAALGAQNAQLRGVVNQVYGDYTKTMGSRRIGATDKLRLDNYMSILSSLDKQLGAPVIQCSSRIPAGTVASLTAGSWDTAEALHNSAFDLEVAALACGMTKIVMHGLMHHGSSLTANSSSSETWHGGAHSPTTVLSDGKKAADYNLWTMNRVAEYLKKLDAVIEPDGNTLLDNTLFMYGNDDSSGLHWLYDLPVVLAGAKGKLRTDLFIDYRSLTDKTADFFSWPLGRPYNNLLISALKTCGLTPEDYQKLPNQIGFGKYEGYNASYAAHYAPYLGQSIRNESLPTLFI